MLKPEIILGPPGTGKTTYLLQLVDEALAAGTKPDRIAYLAFTKKAATEAIDRAQAKFDLVEKDLPYFRTIHSLAFRLLGLRKDEVLGSRTMEEFSDLLGLRLNGGVDANEGRVYGSTPGDKALFIAAMARIRCIPLEKQWEEMNEDLGWFEVERVDRGLREFKLSRGLKDFTDMLLDCVERGLSIDTDLLVVDEAQDLSQAQWRLVQNLSKRARRTIIAGDDDQAIFRWAGADVEYFIGLEGKTTVLDKSYRVPKKIQEVAARVIDRVTVRRHKDWSPRDEDGEVSYHGSTDDIDMVKGSWLVLARNEYLLDDVEKQCRREGLVYTRRGRRSISDRDLSTIKAWESLRKGGEASAKDVRNILRYIVHTGPGLPKSGLFVMDDLRRTWGISTDEIWHEAFDKMSLIERSYLLSALRQGEKITKTPRINLSTIHSAKGGEADSVILYTDMSRRTFQGMMKAPEDERRVFYVGATRAKQSLYIINPKSKFHFTS